MNDIDAIYTIDRSPKEILDVWLWAESVVNNSDGMHNDDALYHHGILAVFEYLSGETDKSPLCSR